MKYIQWLSVVSLQLSVGLKLLQNKKALKKNKLESGCLLGVELRSGARNCWGFFVLVVVCPPHEACGILVPLPRIEPRPWQWKRRILTTGLPGNSQDCWFFIRRIVARFDFLIMGIYFDLICSNILGNKYLIFSNIFFVITHSCDYSNRTKTIYIYTHNTMTFRCLLTGNNPQRI